MKTTTVIRAALVVALLGFSAPARADGTTVQFPFQDARYLHGWQHDGGAAYVPEAALVREGPVPVVVFLHGVNPYGQLHLWLDGPLDLRPTVDELTSGVAQPFVLAAPSQTRDASIGKELWPELDVPSFIAEVAGALRGIVTVDAERVYVVGHSGAGCNTDGGLARLAGVSVSGVLAVDTCLDEEVGAAFSRLSSDLWVMWQSKTWSRDIAAFERGLGPFTARTRIDLLRIDAPAPHDAIVYRGLRRMAQAWLAR